MSFMPLEVDPRVQGTTHLILVRGELDLSSVEKLRSALDLAFSRAPETVVLDMSGVTFCDSSGVHLVVTAHRTAGERACRFVVVRPEGLAWRTFEICKVDRWITSVESGREVAPSATSPGLSATS